MDRASLPVPGPSRLAQLLGLRRLLGSDHAPPSAGAATRAAEVSTPAPRADAPARSRAVLVESLGQKVLHAWLQNRNQTLLPLTLNLRSLDLEERSLVLCVAASAVAANGRGPDLGLADAALARIGAGERERQVLRDALAAGTTRGLFEAVTAAGLGTHAYGAALLAVDRRDRVNQHYLAYLAARFALPDDAVASLHRRYRM